MCVTSQFSMAQFRAPSAVMVAGTSTADWVLLLPRGSSTQSASWNDSPRSVTSRTNWPFSAFPAKRTKLISTGATTCAVSIRVHVAQPCPGSEVTGRKAEPVPRHGFGVWAGRTRDQPGDAEVALVGGAGQYTPLAVHKQLPEV